MEREYAKSNGYKKRIRPNMERIRLRNVRRDASENSQKYDEKKNNKKQRK